MNTNKILKLSDVFQKNAQGMFLYSEGDLFTDITDYINMTGRVTSRQQKSRAWYYWYNHMDENQRQYTIDLFNWKTKNNNENALDITRDIEWWGSIIYEQARGKFKDTIRTMDMDPQESESLLKFISNWLNDLEPAKLDEINQKGDVTPIISEIHSRVYSQV